MLMGGTVEDDLPLGPLVVGGGSGGLGVSVGFLQAEVFDSPDFVLVLLVGLPVCVGGVGGQAEQGDG